MRRRVELGLWTVLDDHARSCAESGAGFVGGDLLGGLDKDRFSMADRDRHTHTSGGNAQSCQVHDLACLVDDLDLFLVEAVHVGMPTPRDNVVRELVGINDSLRLSPTRD